MFHFCTSTPANPRANSVPLLHKTLSLSLSAMSYSNCQKTEINSQPQFRVHERITLLNNKGVALLHNDLQRSMSCFRLAIVYAKKVSLSKTFIAESIGKIWRTPLSMKLRASFGACETNIMVEGAFLRAINLISLPTVYSEDPDTYFSIILATLHFNLAIAHHQNGLKTKATPCDDPVKAQLLKARALYFKAFQYISKVDNSGKSLLFGKELLELSGMACCNNLAHIAYSFADFKTSGYHLNQLLLCSNRIDTCCREATGALYIEWYKMIFLKNALYLQPPTIASAA